MKISSGKVLFGFILVVLLCQCNAGSNQNSNQNQSDINASLATVESVQEIQNTQASDLPSINITANQVLESPINIKVNSEGKWGGFEGELGTIELFDEKNNTMGKCILSTTASTTAAPLVSGIKVMSTL